MDAFVANLAEAARIVLFCVLAAVTYGVLHDQVTAHLCVEYFSVAHPPVFHTASPFLLALGWGVIATWWVGLPLGIGLALAARLGPTRRLSFAQVRPHVFWVFAIAAVSALVSGCVGAWLVASGRIAVPGGWGAVIVPAHQVAFSADAFAHLASYSVGALGGLAAITWAVVRRLRRA